MSSSSTIRPLVIGIRAHLASLLDGSASPASIKAVVTVAHAIAEGALRRRGHLYNLISRQGISHSDLAYDCIGDLLARDPAGRYLPLESYFSAFPIEEFTDEEAFFHLQRLVYTKVRNGVFRMYQELDPQLGRILHNIKGTNRTLGIFTVVERLGDGCLQPFLCDSLEHLPRVEADELAAWLAQEASGSEFIPELLGKISLIVKRQEERSRIVPIVTIGLAIRQFYEKLRVPQIGEGLAYIDENALDARGVVASTITEIKENFRALYVGKGRVSERAFEAYCEVIYEMLSLRFVEQDGADFELSATFLSLFPGMTKEEYRVEHKNKLEYLARLAHARAAESLLHE